MSDINSGPGLLRLTKSNGTEPFTPDTSESIVGAHSTYVTDEIMHLRSAGVVLYLKNSDESTFRSATFDLNGELVDSAEISGNNLINAEIRSSGNINSDSYIGAELQEELFAPTNISGGNPQRYVYQSDRGLILFRNQPVPSGPDNILSIESSSFDINGYDGPSIVAVDDSVSLTNTEKVTVARVTRSPISAGSYLTLADGFELYISDDNTDVVRVVKFNLDGSFQVLTYEALI